MTTLAIALALALPVLAAPAGQAGPLDDVVAIAGDVACSVPPVAELLCVPGAEAWVGRYDGTGAGHDYLQTSAVSPDGTRVFVTGQSPGTTTSADYATVAYDALLGIQLWAARHDGTASGFDVARDIAVDPSGTKVFVTGGTRTSAGGAYTTIAYDAVTGAASWVADHAAGFGDRAEALVVSPDGERLFVTGGDRGDFGTVAYDAADGTELWRTSYRGPVNGYESAMAIALSPDGARLFVTGFSPAPGTDLDYVTIAYDAADGTQLWDARYNGPGNSYDIPQSLATSPDGAQVYVTGFGPGAGTGAGDFATVAYDAASGAEAWVARYDGTASGYDVGLEVVSGADAVYVTGFSDGASTGRDYATIAYDPENGDPIWTARHETTGRDAANGLALSPDGAMLYVTGESGQPPLGNDMLTVAYDARDGREAWSVLYDGPGTGDIGQSVSVSPDGLRVFAAGYSQGAAGSWDYAVVAYEAGLA